ncbi:tyrosine-type recombinase/integrase [Microbacterium sp.]|uniref:tyrosine-type recombinase/integrase n=1 Tax=Microbacterium sp. TaxID=51671 RepID=UPI003C761399
MGSVQPYETKDGRRYRVRYRRPDNTQTDKRGFTTKKDALLFLASVEVKKAQGEFIDASKSRITVGELGPSWLAGKRPPIMKASAYRSLDSAWRIHVEPFWGHRTIGSIASSEVQEWIAELSQTRGATTVLRAHGVLAGILDGAKKDLRITLNPARELELPKKKRKRRSYLTHEQVHALATTSRHPELVNMLAYTGLRWGEVTGIRVWHIDLARRRILIEENAVMVNATIVLGTTKDDEDRTVPIPEFLLPFIAGAVVTRTREDYVFGPGDDPMPLPNSKAGWFAGAVKRARKADTSFPHITPHGLRHTAASLAISAGANVKAVQRMLGHASAAMTLDTYADLFDDDLDDVAISMSRARSRALSETEGTSSADSADA